MSRRRQREQELTEFMAAAAEAQQRVAAAAEAHNESRPDLRIHALAYSIQSFSGREVETSQISLRAEAFFLFLSESA